MSQKSSAPAAKLPAEKLVRDIRRATRKHHSAEDKMRIVLEGLRGEPHRRCKARPDYRTGPCRAGVVATRTRRALH